MANEFFPQPRPDNLTNPYAPPTVNQTSWPSAPVETRGQQNIWRDGKRVVVMRPNFAFPAVCVKTGRIDDLAPQQQTLKFVQGGVIWAVMFGAIGALIAQALFGQTLKLTFPLCSSWLANKKMHGRIGLFIALSGGALFILGLVGIVVCNPQEDFANILVILVLVAMFVGLGGLIYMAIAGSNNILSIQKIDGNVTWLDGAGAEFLSQLPEWSLTGPIGAPGVLRRS